MPCGVRALSSTCSRAKRLLSIVTGTDDNEDSDDDELQPFVQRRQERDAYIMISSFETGPFLFFQGVNNDCSRRQQRSCGHTSHTRHKVPRHRHVVCHVSRQRVHHQEVSSWSAHGDVSRRVRRTGNAAGSGWSRFLVTDACCQFLQLAV
jgi:hypothetical protein